MTDNNAVWPGTPDEHAVWTAVVVAAMKDCLCRAAETDMYGNMTRATTCSLHLAAVEDQRWLNGLVLARRIWRMRAPNGRNRVEL